MLQSLISDILIPPSRRDLQLFLGEPAASFGKNERQMIQGKKNTSKGQSLTLRRPSWRFFHYVFLSSYFIIIGCYWPLWWAARVTRTFTVPRRCLGIGSLMVQKHSHFARCSTPRVVSSALTWRSSNAWWRNRLPSPRNLDLWKEDAIWFVLGILQKSVTTHS